MLTGPIRAALVAALFGPGACSRAPEVSAPAPVAAPGYAPNACVRDLAPADLTRILGRSGVTAKATPGHAEACQFVGPGGRVVTVSLRSGEEVAPFWKLAVNARGDTMIPLAVVGEKALRTPQGDAVLARQGPLSCEIELVVPSAPSRRRTAGGSGDDLARNLAALCAKVFTARERLDGRPAPAMVAPSPPQ